MTDFTLTCPECGGAIQHQCGANLSTQQTQILPQSDPQAQIAHGSKSLSAPKNRAYNQGYDQEFLTFWSVYPLKRDKRKAQLAWRKSVDRLAQITGANRRIAMAQILAGAVRYRDDPNRVLGYTKWAEGWLNGDGWEDEPLPPRGHQGYESAATRMLRSRMTEGGDNGSGPSTRAGSTPRSGLPGETG